MPPQTNPRDPWRKAPVGELQDQLLPRWFVLLCIALIPIAIGALVAGFVVFGPEEVPVAERRPPPANGLTNDVGQFEVGEIDPVPYTDACPILEGVRIAGTEEDRQALRLGLAGVCNTTLPPVIADRIELFAGQDGIVRFAQFQSTGVDSTVKADERPPQILINAKLQRTDPLWISPLVVHDAVILGGGAATVPGALQARRAEDLVCDRLLAGRRESRGCADAEALLALPIPKPPCATPDSADASLRLFACVSEW